jgi:hypothetical protein
VRACPGPLYNRYGDGGFVIWFVPETPVFLDSRQDPYPLRFVLDAVADDARGAYEATFARHGIRCALLPPGWPTSERLLRAGWRPSYADDAWLVLVPPGAP